MTTSSDPTHAFQRLADAEAAIAGEGCLLRVEIPGVGVWEHAAGGI